MPAIVRWSRSSGCRWRGWSISAANSLERGRGPGLRPQRRHHLVGLDLLARQQLRPGPLLGPELAQPQLPPVLEPDQQPRGAISRRGRLVEDLQPPRRHQVDQQRQVAELDHRHLADPPDRRSPPCPPAPRAAARRSSSRSSPAPAPTPTRRPAQGAVEPARGDLDLGDFGHGQRVDLSASSFDWLQEPAEAAEPANINQPAPIRVPSRRAAMRELPTINEPVPMLDLSPEEIDELSEEVRALAAERDAVILAHNYQVPEVQDVADFVGDSLGLSRKAAAADASVIAFCGVHFMAETASILSPVEDRADPRPRRRLLARRTRSPPASCATGSPATAPTRWSSCTSTPRPR